MFAVSLFQILSRFISTLVRLPDISTESKPSSFKFKVIGIHVSPIRSRGTSTFFFFQFPRDLPLLASCISFRDKTKLAGDPLAVSQLTNWNDRFVLVWIINKAGAGTYPWQRNPMEMKFHLKAPSPRDEMAAPA